MDQTASLTKRNTATKIVQVLTLAAASFVGTQDLSATEPVQGGEPPVATANGTVAERDLTLTAGRVELLEEIRGIAETIDSDASVEERREVFKKIKPLVLKYSNALAEAQDATIEELENAKNLNFSTINYTHRTDGLDQQEEVSYVRDMVLPFYEAQVPALRDYGAIHPESKSKVKSLLSSIQGDIRYCIGFGQREGSIAVGEVTADLFVTAEHVQSLKKFKESIDRENSELFTLTVLQARQELLGVLIKEAFGVIEIAEARRGQKEIKSLFEMHSLYHDALEVAGADLLDENELREAKNWVREHQALPIFNKLPELLHTLYGSSGIMNSSELQDSFANLIESLATSRVELGDQYTAQLKTFLAANTTSERFRLEAYTLLSQLAPDPAGLEFAVRDIENIMLSQRSPTVTPGRVVPALGAILFSGMHNEILASESSHKGSSSFGSVKMLLDSDTGLENISPALLPQYILLTRILRAGLSGNALKGFPGLVSADYEVQRDVAHTSRAITLRILNDLAKAYSRDLHARSPLSLTYLSAPLGWGAGVVAVPHPEPGQKVTEADRQKAGHYVQAGRSLFSLVELISEKLAEIHEVKGQAELIQHMVWAIDLADSLEHSGNPAAHNMFRVLEKEFRYISTRTEGDGPFEHMYLAAQEMQYQRIHQRGAPPAAPSDAIFARAQWRDKKIDSRSIDFAKTAQERFKCELALTLIGSTKENRPLERHRILSDPRMQKELMVTMDKLGLIELVPGRKRFNPEAAEKSSFEAILEEAPAEQLKSALTSRAALLKDKQIALLKIIRGIEE